MTSYQDNNNQDKKDRVFAQKIDQVKPFVFNQDVAEVFDDMVTRSIPFYQEIIRVVLDMTRKFSKGGQIYDLGCSTGNTLLALTKEFHNQMVGIDSSIAMIEKAREKLNTHSNITLEHKMIEDVEYINADIVIFNYTLQFIEKNKREVILQKIYQSLNPGGIIIISEKVASVSSPIESAMTDLYYEFKKRNGYSELEISQKREALENRLIPLDTDSQLKMLKNSGFKNSDLLFKWYNFASYIGIKS